MNTVFVIWRLFKPLRLSDAYICISNLTTIGSDYGLSPGWRQDIIWTNAKLLLIAPLGKSDAINGIGDLGEHWFR